MNKVSTHFKRAEFACNCGCGFAAADIELVNVLEDVRSHFQGRSPLDQVYIEINSGCRCHSYNEKVQLEANPKYVPGSSRSFHVKGMASDIVVWIGWHVKQLNPDLVADYLDKKYPLKFGIGRYDTFTHIDTRPYRARWDNRSVKHGV